MRRWMLFLVLAAAAFPAPAAERVTVAQLRQFLAAQRAAHKKDGETAKRLGSMELTERLAGPDLEQMIAGLKPDGKIALSLELLASTSAFLEPPGAELPGNAKPEFAAQQAMVNKAVEFVSVRLKELPDFLAIRTTQSFDDSPPLGELLSTGEFEGALHLTGTFTQQITYRNGQEILDDAPTAPGARRRRGPSEPVLKSQGDFGGVLATVLIDAAKGKMTWGRWEQSAGALVAVFQFKVPAESSHYKVDFCCVQASAAPSFHFANGDANSYRGTPGYHGTLSIDPSTGAILRLTLEPELMASDPITESSLWVQYGKVDIGGKSYMCPVQSGVITLARSVDREGSTTAILRVNHVTFTDYHRFGSTAKILANAPSQ